MCNQKKRKKKNHALLPTHSPHNRLRNGSLGRRGRIGTAGGTFFENIFFLHQNFLFFIFERQIIEETIQKMKKSKATKKKKQMKSRLERILFQNFWLKRNWHRITIIVWWKRRRLRRRRPRLNMLKTRRKSIRDACHSR